MGDVVEFRPKRLSGFIPETPNAEALRGATQGLMASLPVYKPGYEPVNFDDIFRPVDVSFTAADTACSEIHPDSGDCA